MCSFFIIILFFVFYQKVLYTFRENKICLPKHILATVEKIAEIKNVTEQDILDFSKHNTFQLFPVIQSHFGGGEAYLSEKKINE